MLAFDAVLRQRLQNLLACRVVRPMALSDGPLHHRSDALPYSRPHTGAYSGRGGVAASEGVSRWADPVRAVQPQGCAKVPALTRKPRRIGVHASVSY